jgi:hypothetical protein
VDHPLAGCFEKLDRARAHLQCLEMDAMTFASEGDLYRIRAEADVQTGETVIRFGVLREVPALRWGVLVGDFAHNLHSALDHLVWQLVLREGHADPAELKTTAFPIRSTRQQWEDVISKRRSRKFAPHGTGPLAGLVEGGKAWAAIEACQPFATIPESPWLDPLAALRWLWNEDKHRVVAAAHNAVGVDNVYLHLRPGCVVESVETRDGPFQHDGAEIARLRIRGARILSDPGVDVYGTMTFGVAFGTRPETDRGIERRHLPRIAAAVDLAFGSIATATGIPSIGRISPVPGGIGGRKWFLPTPVGSLRVHESPKE